MKFEIDRQTINDLELFDKVKGEKSVFSLFNFTKSIGGKIRLEDMFSHPLTSIESIEKRLTNIEYFMTFDVGFDVDKECLDFVEYYLAQQNAPQHYSAAQSLFNALKYKIKPKNEYYIVQRGIRYLIVLLNELYDFSKQLEDEKSNEYIQIFREAIRKKFEGTTLKATLKFKNRRKLYPQQFGKLDHCFRKTEISSVRQLLEFIYEVDVYKSVAFAANKFGFSLPVLNNTSGNFIAQDVYHPFLEHPVANDFEFINGKNICFITGPNMAGKSTFLKSISICVYLSHIGFPVPAKYLQTPLFGGLLTTINLSDNINKGYSHFYNEVLRVKFVAERLNQCGNIFIVFDELFRGTNVKDAYEASLSVITAFSKLNRGVFTISTHIIEIAKKLIDNQSIFFKYFDANLINETPEYNYKIKEGVTNARLGMYILKKEKVLETIEGAVRKDLSV